KLSQIGTPDQLKQRLGCARLEVRTAQVDKAEKILLDAVAQSSNQIEDVQTFGDRLDVLVGQVAPGEMQIRNALEHHQLGSITIQSADPTLENVFVSRLRQQGNDPAFIPLPRLRPPVRKDDEIAIGAYQLSKTFGSFEAVKSVTLKIRYGEIYGLLGANGAGKTTTIKMLCGLLGITRGDITLAGCRQNLRSSALRQRIGYMSQKFSLYDDLSILENLDFYYGVYGVPYRKRREKIDWVLDICGLVGKEDMLTGQLPGGWKQRVAFGASVMHEPEILFLDEPTSGVDPLARRQFWRQIEDLTREGTAVLVTTHYLEEAEHCNRMAFMVAGEVVTQGSPSDVKAAQPGQLIEILVARPQVVLGLLKQHFASWRVSLFGDRLHIVLDNPDREIPQLTAILNNAQVDIIQLQAIPFSLEDAFIGIVQRAQEIG
ncbi:MAG: ABC transporter ATP-binding protein, partial [Cyanobacteria bacterium P01_F01_bin.4]